MDASPNTPAVSVIIPTYNRSARVADAVRSVLHQTFEDWELIVVDDGSTDGTARILDGWDTRMRVVSQSRSGVSSARNRGVEESRGDLIAFLDSDDRWLSRKLEVQTAFFHRFPGAIICQTEEIWIRNGRRVNPRAHHRKQGGDIFRISLERCMISPSAVMMRRRLLEETGGFDPSLQACEDYDLWLRVTARHPVALIPEPLLIRYGGHPDQLSRTVPALDRLRIASLCNLLEAGTPLTSEQRAWIEETLLKKARVYLTGCIRRKKWPEVHRILNRVRSVCGGSALIGSDFTLHELP